MVSAHFAQDLDLKRPVNYHEVLMRGFSPALYSDSQSTDVDPEIMARYPHLFRTDSEQLITNAIPVHHTSTGRLIGTAVRPVDVLRNARRLSADQGKRLDPYMRRTDWLAQVRRVTPSGIRPGTTGPHEPSPLVSPRFLPGHARPSTARPASSSTYTFTQHASHLMPAAPPSVHSCPPSPVAVRHIIGQNVPGGYQIMVQAVQHKLSQQHAITSSAQQPSKKHASGRPSAVKSPPSRGLVPQAPFQLSLGYHQPLKLMMDQQGRLSDNVHDLMLLSQRSSGVDKRIDEYRLRSACTSVSGHSRYAASSQPGTANPDQPTGANNMHGSTETSGPMSVMHHPVSHLSTPVDVSKHLLGDSFFEISSHVHLSEPSTPLQPNKQRGGPVPLLLTDKKASAQGKPLELFRKPAKERTVPAGSGPGSVAIHSDRMDHGLESLGSTVIEGLASVKGSLIEAKPAEDKKITALDMPERGVLCSSMTQEQVKLDLSHHIAGRIPQLVQAASCVIVTPLPAFRPGRRIASGKH